jgi:hypothetical protein
VNCLLTRHLHLFVQSIFYGTLKNPSMFAIGVEGEAANNMLECIHSDAIEVIIE